VDTDRPVTAVIIDDHPIVAEGARSWCAAARPVIELVAASDRIVDAWTGPGATADVVVVDLILSTTGIHEVGEVRKLAAAGRRVVVHTGETDKLVAVRCITAGALAYVTKNESRDHLAAAVLAASQGESYTTPSLSGAILADPLCPHLAPREVEALRRWFTSSSKRMAARSMQISEKTLDTYISRVRAKYDEAGRPAPSQAKLVARTLRDGVFTLDDLG
jgi:DNA-binding NarL/FixJ family response regulator